MAARNLRTGSVTRHLFMLGGPMSIGIVSVMSISLADAYFIGQFSTQQLAALGFAFPVIFTFTSIGIGLGAGAASVVSRAIGGNDADGVRQLATASLLLASSLVLIASIAGYLTIEPLFRLLGADADLLGYIHDYMSIWYVGLVFLIVPMVANNILRADGDALWPSGLMVMAALLNILLDPIFIYGYFGVPRLEIEGAAWASLIARSITAILALALLISRGKFLDLRLPTMARLLTLWRKVAAVAVPAATGNMINPVAVAVLTAVLAQAGSETVAGFGVATRIEAFAAIPMFALSAAIGPLSGQNWGALDRDRIAAALKRAFVFSVFWSCLLAAGLFIFAHPLAALFTSDPAVQSIMETYLRIVPISLAGFGITVVSAACFNAIGHARIGLFFYILRSILLYIPLATLAFALYDGAPAAVFAAIAVANVLAGLVMATLSLRFLAVADHDASSAQIVRAGLSFLVKGSREGKLVEDQ